MSKTLRHTRSPVPMLSLWAVLECWTSRILDEAGTHCSIPKLQSQHGCSQRPLVKGRSKSVQLSLNLKSQPSRQSLQKTGTGLCASRESAEAAKVPDSGINGAVSLWLSGCDG